MSTMSVRSNEPEITKKPKQSEEKIIRAIKERINRDIDNIFEQEGNYYCKPKRASNFYRNNCI